MKRDNEEEVYLKKTVINRIEVAVLKKGITLTIKKLRMTRLITKHCQTASIINPAHLECV
jgi:hypothetical protein